MALDMEQVGPVGKQSKRVNNYGCRKWKKKIELRKTHLNNYNIKKEFNKKIYIEREKEKERQYLPCLITRSIFAYKKTKSLTKNLKLEL